jgi:hypothetical protein
VVRGPGAEEGGEVAEMQMANRGSSIRHSSSRERREIQVVRRFRT